jgi:ADP-ribosylglycohydrolase/uncharacterized protein YegL
MWLAQAILTGGDDHPARFAQLLTERLESIRGIGQATRRSIIRLREGAEWWKSGIPSAGNGVAMRSASAGLAWGDDVARLRRESARSAIVTHADPMAVASGIAQAYAVARLARTPARTLDPAALITEIVAVLEGVGDTGKRLRRRGAGTARVRLVDRIAELTDMLELTPAEAFAHTHNGGFVLESLPAALWAFLSRPDEPEEAIVVAVNGGYDADTVGAMTGALAGAYHGESGLPRRWLDDLEALSELRSLADRLHRRFVVGEPANPGPTSTDDADRVHVAVLLDRSGSMNSIVDDTIGGFNNFVDEQRQLPGDCRLTLVQFDGGDPQEILVDAQPVAEVPQLDRRRYQPRGNTPLLDALGRLIARIDDRVAADPDEYQLVAVITDGHENASREFTRSQIADMVSNRSDAGWAFVFLGANIDSFAEAGAMGMAAGQVGNWVASAAGVADGWNALSVSSRRYRAAAAPERHSLGLRLMDEVRSERQAAEKKSKRPSGRARQR